MPTVRAVAFLLSGVIAASVLLTLTLLPAPSGPNRPSASAQEVPVGIEEVQLVAGCQIRAFMPHYRAGTPLTDIADDISGGNPRLWFMHQAPIPLPTDLFDPASPERSVIDVLTEEAGYVCVDFETVWHRPLWPPPRCTYEPPFCLGAESPSVEPTPSATYAP